MDNIIHTDEYKIYDNLLKYKKENHIFGPIGLVKMFINNKLVLIKRNLVVAQGRGFVAQRIFNINVDKDDQIITPDWRQHYVTHFGVGSGGSVIVGNDDYTLQGPHICDKHIYRPISLGNSLFLDEPKVYDEEDGIHHNRHVLKQIDKISIINQTFPSQTFPEGDYTCEYHTKVKCECNIIPGEPGGLDPGESVQISEAGLYITKYDQDANLYEDPYMFAHICFSPKFKEKESPLSILWYILC